MANTKVKYGVLIAGEMTYDGVEMLICETPPDSSIDQSIGSLPAVKGVASIPGLVVYGSTTEEVLKGLQKEIKKQSKP